MVLPVSGFLPVPLPMMIPFMGAQSLVIGKMFGEGFQYGKRKISAMPNEEFNKLTFEGMMSNARKEMIASIPTMQAALKDMTPLVSTIIQEFTAYLSEVIKAVPESADTIVNQVAHQLFPHGETTQNSTEFQNFMAAIQNQFPSLPSAFATPQGTTGNFSLQGFQEKKFDKFIGPRKPLVAPLYGQRTSALTRAEQIKAFGDPTIKNQVGLLQKVAERRGQIIKRKAGQTQKIEREKLIQEISIWTKKFKSYRQSGTSARVNRANQFRRQTYQAGLRKAQTKLAQLLNRYRW